MKKNVEVIEGIELVIKGLNMIKTQLESEQEVDGFVNVDDTDLKDDSEYEGGTEEGMYTVQELKDMKYNEFKKLAAQLGVKCTGSRDEILDRIVATGVVKGVETVDDPVVVEEDEVVEEKPQKKSSKLGKSKKKAEEAADEQDEFDEQAEKAVESNDVSDIIEALADVGVKATKKNVVEKLAEALREGLIELEDDGEDVDDTEESGSGDFDAEDLTPDAYFEGYDVRGLNNPDEMTKERKKAVEKKVAGILKSYSAGKLTYDDMTDYISDNTTEEEFDEVLGEDYTEEDLFKFYIELIKYTIDNDGEEHEQGEPYEVGEKDVCCGHELKYSKKTKKYICEHCGTEYEAE